MARLLELFPPPSEESIDTFYGPLAIASHNLLAICVCNRYFLDYGVIKCMFLTTSVVSIGAYVLNRTHLRRLRPSKHLMYGMFVTGAFNLGSLHFFHLMSSTVSCIPSCGGVMFRSLLGHVMSSGLLLVGSSYMNYLDHLADHSKSKLVPQTYSLPYTPAPTSFVMMPHYKPSVQEWTSSKHSQVVKKKTWETE